MGVAIKARQKRFKARGFTVIEAMIVMAIAALILVIVFVAVPGLQRNSRDNQRKQYARTLLAALIDYQSKNLGFQVNCYDASSASECAAAPILASRFVTTYMPDGKDPSTGESYRADTTQNTSTQYCNGIGTQTKSTVYCWDDRSGNYVDHNVKPILGQVYIIPVHFCGSHTSTSGYGDLNIRDSQFSTNPGDNPHNSIAVMIGTEDGDYYCVNS